MVASVMVGVLPELRGCRRLLSALDDSGLVAAKAREAGMHCEEWRRWGEGAEPWPACRGMDAAALRIPKGREALVMSLHAVLGCLLPGAPVLVYGANDEGIRSAGRSLGPWLEGLRTLETRRHCRVWNGRAPQASTRTRARGAVVGEPPLPPRLDPTHAEAARLDPPRFDPSDWEQRLELAVPGATLQLVSYPGLFAHGRLDTGTGLLLEALEALPRLRRGARVLDYGCGSGVVGMALARRQPELSLHGVDRDALAILAARSNLPKAQLHLGDGWAAVPRDARFDLVVSNPPLHDGSDRDLSALDALVEGAARRLGRRGALVLVTRRPLPLEKRLGACFGRVGRLRETPSYTVWQAQDPHPLRRDSRAPSADR